MKISANGLSRQVRSHKLLDAKLNGRGSNVVYVPIEKEGVKIRFATKKITLNGQYDFEILLSREEIAAMFFQTFRHESIETIIAAMSSESR